VAAGECSENKLAQRKHGAAAQHLPDCGSWNAIGESKMQSNMSCATVGRQWLSRAPAMLVASNNYLLYALASKAARLHGVNFRGI